LETTLFTLMYAVRAILFCVQSYGDAEVHSAAECAEILALQSRQAREKEQTSEQPALPEKLQGVFWMSDNLAPELLASFEGATIDEESNTISFLAGAPLNWTYSTGVIGWLYWFYLRLGYLFGARLFMNFDKDYTSASMKIYTCHQTRCACFFGCQWSMEQVDANTWDRGITYCCCPSRTNSFSTASSYTLKRIIDGQGNRLPEYDNMIAQVREGIKIKDKLTKPDMQIMNGKKGGDAFFGLWGKETYNFSSK